MQQSAHCSLLPVIINAASGTSTTLMNRRTDLATLFQANGLDALVMVARNGDELAKLTAQALHEKPHVIVAGGGDGTISAVASHLVETDTALGVLPLGTLNHFAKDLHIPLDLESAARNIIAGRIARIDVGEVNGHIFLNNSSLGLYPSIVRRREQQQRLGSGKWVAFAWAALAVLRRYPFLNVRLNADGAQLARRTPFVFIGNNEYAMSGLNIGARACLDAGHLSLYVAHRTGRSGLLRLAVRALFGRLRDTKDFDALCAGEIWIEAQGKRRLQVATDGEVSMMETPLRYRVRQKALRVIVPPEDAIVLS
jgi:diacylglycerol kinase family enzyme